MKRIRTSTLVIVMLALAFLVIVGTQTSKASGSGGPAATGNPTMQAEPSTPPGAAPAEGKKCSAPARGEVAAGGNPCKSCPRDLAPGCTRVSCDPCCFRCPGDPFIRCL